MVEFGEQGIVRAQRQAAVVAGRDSPFAADVDAVLRGTHQGPVGKIRRRRWRNASRVGKIGIIFCVEIAVGHTDVEIIARAQHEFDIGAVNLRRGGVADQASGSTAAKVYDTRSEEHTSELQSLMRISYAVFCWKKKN